MKDNYLGLTITEVFTNKSEDGMERQYKIKKFLMPFFSEIEKNIQSLFNLDTLSYKSIKTELFKKSYKYLNDNFSIKQIQELFNILRKCRNLCWHFITPPIDTEKYILKDCDKFFELSLFEDVPTQIDNEITIHGLLVLMMLFMSNDQINDFTIKMRYIDEYNIYKYIHGKKRKNKIEEQNKRQVALMKKFKGYNNIKSSLLSVPDNKFFKNILEKLSLFILDFEKGGCYAFNLFDELKEKDGYSTTSDILSHLDISEKLKKDIINLRCVIAHGEYNQARKKIDDELLLLLVNIVDGLIKELKNKEMLKVIKQYSMVLKNFIEAKYKRMVELVLKVTNANNDNLIDSESTQRRLEELNRMNYVMPEIRIKIEKNISNMFKNEKFKINLRNNKKIAIDTLKITHINLYDINVGNAIYFTILGNKVLGNKITFAEFDEYPLPTILAFDKNDKQIEIDFSIKQEKENTGFFKKYEIIQ